jgi:hypothetical protein
MSEYTVTIGEKPFVRTMCPGGARLYNEWLQSIEFFKLDTVGQARNYKLGRAPLVIFDPMRAYFEHRNGIKGKKPPCPFCR